MPDHDPSFLSPAPLYGKAGSGHREAVPMTVDQQCLLDLGLAHPQWVCAIMLFDVRQPLDVDLLRQSVHLLMLRHEVLRATFHRIDDQWQQYIDSNAPPVSLQIFDIASPIEGEKEYLSALAVDTCNNMDLAHGPLLRCVLVNNKQLRHTQLLMAVHHLLTDGLSTCVLVGELAYIYECLSADRPTRLAPPAVSFSQWTRRLHQFVNSDLAINETDYWCQLPWSQFMQVPVDDPARLTENTLATHQKHSIRLTRHDTETLMLEFRDRFATTIVDTIVTALLEVFTDNTGNMHLALFVHDAARDVIADCKPALLANTVGWLSFQRLLHLHRPGTDCRGLRLLESVRAQLQAIPNRGLGFKLLKHCCKDVSIRHKMSLLPEPQLWLNYIGPVSSALDTALFDVSPLMADVSRHWMHPDSRQKWLLSYVVAIENEQLVISLDSSNRLYQPQTIKRLNACLAASLHRMLDEVRAGTARRYAPVT